MNQRLGILVAALFVLIPRPARAQTQSEDSLRQQMPKLEIPEITIIGKKAITLPFARKGETYDFTIYQAPPPDSSLLGQPPALPLAKIPLPGYAERRVPLHVAADAGIGSFSAGFLRGYADYAGDNWGLAGDGGYRTTTGHTANSSLREGSVDVDGYSVLRTDNEILKDLRLSAATAYSHDSYGMFGILGPPVERRRDQFGFTGELRSLDQAHNGLDLSVGTGIWSVHDIRSNTDSSVSSVSPNLDASYGTSIRDVHLTAGLSFASSSLDYSIPSQTPNVLSFTASARWRTAGNLMLTLGGLYATASGMQGEGQTLFSPTAEALLSLDEQSELSFWWHPAEVLNTFDMYAKDNLYLMREVTIAPERKPVNFGGSFVWSGSAFRFDFQAAYEQSSNRSVMVADKGNLSVDLVDATQFTAQVNGLLKPTSSARLIFMCLLQSAYEKGSTVQLPMTPFARIQARGEYDIVDPVSVWGTLDYWSEQNVDLLAQHQLSGTALAGAGISSTFLPRSVISFEVTNLLNTSYDWWSGYVAPGRQVALRAQVSIQ